MTNKPKVVFRIHSVHSFASTAATIADEIRREGKKARVVKRVVRAFNDFEVLHVVGVADYPHTKEN